MFANIAYISTIKLGKFEELLSGVTVKCISVVEVNSEFVYSLFASRRQLPCELFVELKRQRVAFHVFLKTKSFPHVFSELHPTLFVDEPHVVRILVHNTVL